MKNKKLNYYKKKRQIDRVGISLLNHSMKLMYNLERLVYAIDNKEKCVDSRKKDFERWIKNFLLKVEILKKVVKNK